MATKRRGGKGKSKDSKEKVKKAAKTDTGGSLAERRKRIRERYSRPVVVYEKDPTAEHVPLDFVALARLLGGGVKKGSIVEVYGPEDAGKTSFSVAVAGMIQRRAAKKSVRSWAQASAWTPGTTSTRWLSRGSSHTL